MRAWHAAAVGALGLPPAAPPFPVQAPHRVVPAPRPLGHAPHLLLDDTWPTAVARRLERLRDEVVVRDPADRDDDGLAAALHRKAFLAVPAPLMKLAAGDLAPEVLGSVNGRPAALERAGYDFEDEDVREVLAAALS